MQRAKKCPLNFIMQIKCLAQPSMKYNRFTLPYLAHIQISTIKASHRKCVPRMPIYTGNFAAKKWAIHLPDRDHETSNF